MSSKMQIMLGVSEEILSDLESESISLEKILSKCKKLARMRDDFEAIDWFTLELHGYAEDSIPSGIKKDDLFKFASRSGRDTLVTNPVTKKTESKYWIASVVELEAGIQTDTISLENLKPPTQFSPAVSKSSFESIYTGQTSSEHVVEKYQDVLNALQVQKNYLSSGITRNKSLLSKIRNNIYNYILNIYLQLKFEDVTETLFQTTKEQVDKTLVKVCPEAIKKFVAVYDRLKSDNPEEWSQAFSSCRNILKDFADYVFPAQKEDVTLSDGRTLEVTADKYKNRLLSFVDRASKGNKRQLLMSRTADLEDRIHNLNSILSQGTHEGINAIDVNICVLDTYFLIGSLLSLTDTPSKK